MRSVALLTSSSSVVAVLRKAALELRPQAVHDEGIGPCRSALLPVGVLALCLAIARRPGQRQHVEVEALADRQIAAGRRAGLTADLSASSEDGPQPAINRKAAAGRPYPSTAG